MQRFFINTRLRKRFLLIGSAFVVYYLFSYLLDPYAAYWLNYFQQSFTDIAIDVGISIVLCTVLAELTLYIDGYLNGNVPWTEKPLKRFLLQASLQLVSSLLAIAAFIAIIYFIYGDDKTISAEKNITNFTQWVATSIFLSLMISAVNTGNYMLTSWKKTAIEAMEHKLKAAEHKQAAVEAELQALKLQMDSHFVFNNLSVLPELILEDQQLGYDYAENFAKVYRYLLVNSKKDLISVEEEMKFLNAYLFLMKNRIGEGVVFDIDIDKAVYTLQIPPLTLQLLIENALKHNQTAKANPLQVRIFSQKGKELVISNAIIPLVNKHHSTSVGLNNVIGRYALLSQEKPVIEQTNKVFTVTVPLI